MARRNGKRIPSITNRDNIRLGYREETHVGSSRYGCMVGASVGWGGNSTINCENYTDCSTSNCILHKSNYEDGMAFLTEEKLISTAAALEFDLSKAAGLV